MNVEIGTEAAQFPEKEYINGIAFAVWLVTSRLGTTNLLPFLQCIQCKRIFMYWLILQGAGGRKLNNARLQGMSLSSLRWQSLYEPLFFSPPVITTIKKENPRRSLITRLAKNISPAYRSPARRLLLTYAEYKSRFCFVLILYIEVSICILDTIHIHNMCELAVDIHDFRQRNIFHDFSW